MPSCHRFPIVLFRALARLALVLLLWTPTAVLAHGSHGGHHDGTGDQLRAPAHQGHHSSAMASPVGRDETAGGKTKTDEDEEETWDVMNPPLERYETPLEVDEGTWMNLDVSPEGDEIVFDLLGDLYRLPMSGGDAEALTTGLAWDMQPRYSPDGKTIAFTSDRGGGDNIWLIDRDGSNPRAVSEEDFRLLNNAAWSPDGDWLAARKHFTSRRSLGAGEIWLYHRGGGEGLQLNTRPNDQKDLGEPAFSPDGRYIYFSQDTTPGDTFQYNKDSNDQIYVIQRLDRETGEIEPFVTGPGGAVRPTPSPDGRTLAFVRRVRFATTLFVMDLESGRETMLRDDLERDMQETWAVHGVYPNMAWTPDSRQLVYWAGGKLHRLDVTSHELAEIPFRVDSSREMVEAIRQTVEVAPDQVDLRMLRWVEVSPDGSQVVFQTLGKLWLRALPDGEPQRLTTQDDHDEFYPAFSRDGRQIVYTTWHDQALGTLRIADARPGAVGRVVSPGPGHYVEPALSPDGATVVYRKTGGGFLRSPLYSREQGLYAIPAAGGEAVRIVRSGFRPHFGTSSDRVYYQTSLDEDYRGLDSVLLAPRDAGVRTPRHHLTSAAATEFRISPDGRWVAFREGFRAFVAPFTPASSPIEVGPEVESLPLAKVSAKAGDYLHWSGDSRTLHWAHGPTLYERSLEQSFAFLDGAPDELPEPTQEGIDLGFSIPADVPTGTVALVGGRVITMAGEDGEQVLENGTVMVEGDRIVAVGPAAEVVLPEGALVLDVSGHTVMPGLIDVHWHGSQGSEEIVPQENWFNLSSLAFGVTTLHDPSNDTSTFFAAAEMARAGLRTAPRMFSTGTILYGAAGDFKAEIDSYDDALFHLRRMKEVGAISVKSYNQPRRDQRQQVIAAAKELGIMVLPEGGSLFMHNMTQVIDGHTGIEHALPVARVYDDVLQLWGNSRTGYTPTMVVGYGGIWGENYWYHKTNVWENERLMTFTPRFAVDARSRRRVMAPDEEYNHFEIARTVKALNDAGVLVQLGAHGQREGLGAHWELWMFEQGGMSPLQALRAATLNGARYLGLDGDIGSLEEGKLADLVVLEENPLENIRNSETVRYTMVGGRLYDAHTLHQVGNHPEARGKLFWEE